MDDIYHYGVKGMRWGVRKSKAEKAKEKIEKDRSIRKARREVPRLQKKIERSKAAYYKATTAKGEKEALRQYGEYKRELAATKKSGNRMTRGEKHTLIFLSTISALTVSAIASSYYNY